MNKNKIKYQENIKWKLNKQRKKIEEKIIFKMEEKWGKYITLDKNTKLLKGN